MARLDRDAAGYIVGFIIFVAAIPALMCLLAGRPDAGSLRRLLCVLCAAVGLGLSVWSIVYMKRVGQGNPLDAFNHELAPRTSRLMTAGPYALCRNPMLLGVLIYYLGWQIYLLSWRALAVFAVFALIIWVQVRREEQRLERDFGREYRDYKRRVPALLPRLCRRNG